MRIPEIDAFLTEIATVCEKHGLVLAHEDLDGDFLVEDYTPDALEWILRANENFPGRLKEMEI
ncbi:hypothetical protein [Desulfatiglans anilini]|uniref:hypothetical protein n=1 Tax=Desulfatiglans anilini TaxID=90728 RepID=UPI0003F6AFA8|nr:hypothetical protein [Desulfatiglans anilini]